MEARLETACELWRVLPSGMYVYSRVVSLKTAEIVIFTVEVQGKQEAGGKHKRISDGGGSKFLRNVGRLLQNYQTSHLK